MGGTGHADPDHRKGDRRLDNSQWRPHRTGRPSVVRLDLDRSRIATMVREGDDLVIRLTDGQTIRVDHFYGEQKGGDSDLVLRDQQGGQWLAHPRPAARAASPRSATSTT
ncbi:BapA prefix-like domain-containing protein [Sphingomonas sp. I4]